jgi:hypothetical protein
MQLQYDVFLSHKGTDKPQVKQIALALQESQISVWLDEWELQPGKPWQVDIEKAIESSRAIAVFVGPDGMGPWEQPEMRAALEQQVRRGCPVIPVLLPGVAEKIKDNLPLFLRPNTWVDLSNGIDDRVGLGRLRWGITGKKPVEETQTSQPAPRRIEEPRDLESIDVAIANLSRLLRRSNITYFVGAGTCYESPAVSSRTSDIARNLLSELNLISTTYDQLLPTLDIAGMYYAIKSGDGNLENRIAELMALPHAVAPPTHQKLATLISEQKTRPVRRSLRRSPQLIVTTNFDLMMESALLRAGISFTRIVQHRSARRIDINEYRDVRLVDDVVEVRSERGGALQAGVDVPEELDDVISSCGRRTINEASNDGGGENSSLLHELSLQELTEPILYKFLGSQDIPNSCAITAEHYFEFARRTLRRNCIPAQISEIIANSPILFLGYGFLDPDFRLMYFTLLRKPLEVQTDLRYALQLPPERYERNAYRQMEFKTRIWERIKEGALRKLGITTLEEQEDVFLAKLHRAIQQNQ